jgi:protocatechuate 3,4-dioxygenase beta subunit/peroxiredoxin
VIAVLALFAIARPAAAQPKDDALHTLTFLVVDKETGQPIPDLPLSVRLDNGESHTSTDDQGKATINYLADQKYLGVTARPDGYVPITVAWQSYQGKDPIPDSYTLKMEKGTSIGGIIQDEAGKPISGVKVYLIIGRASERRDATGGRPRETVGAAYNFNVRTDDQGKWRYDAAPKELAPPNIRLEHPDYLNDDYFGSTPAPPLPKLRDMTGVMVMKKGISVSGRVLDIDGQPIAGAEIAQGRDRFGSNFPTTKTDGSGSYQFPQVRPNSELVLTVRAKTYAPDVKSLQTGNEPMEVDFKLEPGRVITGRVVDVTGKGIPGVMIATDTWRGFRSLMVRLNTDKDGRFTWREAPADEVLTDFLKQGYSDLRQVPIKPSDQDVVITLKPPMKVTGTVVDANTGKPVENFTVIQGLEWNQGQPISWQRQYGPPIRAMPGGKFEFTLSAPKQPMAVRVEADGYLPEESKTFKDDKETVSLEFKLKPAASTAGTVRLPTGEPAADADVIVADAAGGAYIHNGTVQQRNGPSTRTDAAGKYKVPPQIGKFHLVVVHDRGYAEVTNEQLAKSADVTLQPWAKVQGVVKVGNKPAAGQTVSVNRYDGAGGRDEPRVYHQIDGPTDDQGRFTIDHVPAGRAQVALQVKTGPMTMSYASGVTVVIESGKTIEVALGGTGRPVVGKVAIPPEIADRVNWQYSNTGLRSNVKIAGPKLPDNYADMDDAARRKWHEDWNKSPEGQAFRKAQEEARHFAVVIKGDGSFRVDDVPAGAYTFYINLMDPPKDTAKGWSNELLAMGQMEIAVPDMPGGRSDDPLDVGTLALKRVVKLNAGDPAPALEAKTLDGKPIKLADFKGRFVLIDFWTAAYAGSPDFIPQMKATFDAHGKNPNFVMLSLSLDDRPELAKKVVENKGLGWTHAYLGPWDKTDVPRQWGVQGFPANFLIGPDGKIVAKSIPLDRLKDQVGRAITKQQ